MSERITRADVDRIADSVNYGLPQGFKIVAQGRNGYVGLDLFGSTGPDELRDWKLLDTLHLGRSREVYVYLQGMLRAHNMRDHRSHYDYLRGALPR